MKKYFAELIGTCSLVLFGCGSAVIAGNMAVGPAGIGLLGISIAFGFAVVAMERPGASRTANNWPITTWRNVQ